MKKTMREVFEEAKKIEEEIMKIRMTGFCPECSKKTLTFDDVEDEIPARLWHCYEDDGGCGYFFITEIPK